MSAREALGEVAELLAGLGVDPRQARILAFLAAEGEGRSSDLEKRCRLRQPQVSLATKDLREVGWVQVEERRNGTRGRPVHVYRLHRPLSAILDDLERERREAIGQELARIERLRRLVG